MIVASKLLYAYKGLTGTSSHLAAPKLQERTRAVFTYIPRAVSARGLQNIAQSS